MFKKILFILFVVFLVSCSKKSYDEGDLEYKKVCESKGYEWMEMYEMRNDTPISKTICFGCMVNGNHICTLQEFNELEPALK
ncbi:MAG: hypothetical protein AABX19_02235 [Nanoarchaeota archaeon]